MILLQHISDLPQKSSRQTVSRYLGLGLEKLDRDLYHPEKAYDQLAATGVKAVRIQSGWTKTEKTEGVYDFLWLDEIVDSLLSRGMEPWICLCYGNPVYTPAAVDAFGAVAYPPVRTERERTAWVNYVLAVVGRYQGRVKMYEIWNEPEWLWKYGNDPVAYGEFALMTAKAIKEAYPETYILSGALTNLDPAWADKMLSTGLDRYTDGVSYHRYSTQVETLLEEIPKFQAMLKEHGINDLINGESGCQSAPNGAGALADGAWQEDIQAKLILRRAQVDMMTGLKLSSLFTSIDIPEALLDVTGEAYFGILKNNYDEAGKINWTFTEKPSYYAYSNFVSFIDGDFSLTDTDITFQPIYSPRLFCKDEDGSDFILQSLVRPTGEKALLYYKPTNIMTTSFASTASFTLRGFKGEARLLDLLTGKIYALDEKHLTVEGDRYSFRNLPVQDYPLVLTFGDFVR